VLIEGFKQEPVPKLEVYRPENGKPPLFPERPDIVAVATDADIATTLAQAAAERHRAPSPIS
jgi:molybdopterin-guanine dinucleotide biosynthesis protein B